MKKNLLFVALLIFICSSTFAQSASDFFPANVGQKWHFNLYPLDSLGNAIEALKTAEIDSFAGTTTIFDREAKVILYKSGGINTINFQPYTDTTFINIGGGQANIHFSVFNTLDSSYVLDSLLSLIDPSLVNFFSFLQSLSDWYPAYDFTANVNSSTTLFTKDTTITIDSVSIPIRFYAKSKRLSDENFQTYLGTHTCKKFELSASLALLVQIIPSLPPVPIDLITFPVTQWIAPNLWKIREYMPNISVTDIPGFDIPSFTIPGYVYELTDSFVGVQNENNPMVSNFSLEQNFPNPFNPSTNITFTINETSKVKLTVFNVLGKQIATLVDHEMMPGSYNLTFNTRNELSNLSSGIYFYNLTTNSGSITKKMTLIK